MRTFKLINELGVTYDITSKSAFFTDLSGLGFSMNNTYRRVGSRFVLTKKEQTQSVIKGTIVFTPDDILTPYQKYAEFVSFCRSQDLIMQYAPEEVTYSIRCTVSSIEKTEIDYNTSALICPVEFTTLGPWFRTITKVVEPRSDENSGWRWGSATWPIKWASDEPMSIVIDSDANKESPCKLTIYGPILNPSWNVYSIKGLMSTGGVNVNVPANCHLVIDNTVIPYSIGLYDASNNLIEDEYQNSNFSTSRFVNLQKGTNTINVISSSGEEVKIQAEAHLYYESV